MSKKKKNKDKKKDKKKDRKRDKKKDKEKKDKEKKKAKKRSEKNQTTKTGYSIATQACADDLLKRSLDELIELIEREIERLKMSLESYRVSEHPQRIEFVRWHIRTLGERQDALDELLALIIAEQNGESEC